MSKKINLNEISTEKSSNYNNLENMSVNDILYNINNEDQIVPMTIKKSIPAIATLIEKCIAVLKNGGRIFYIGSGTSGRLGIVDASECPPTYGVDPGVVIGIIAGGDSAIRKSIEGAEDSLIQGYRDLKAHKINPHDIVIGISASGRTPYVVGALKKCQEKNIATGCIVCSSNSIVSTYSDYPIEVIVGPEFVTGSTRMKAGTAEKLVLNMITTTSMICTGHVEGNRMIDMQLSNSKLTERGIKTVMEKTQLSYSNAKKLLEINDNKIRKALESFRKK
ncbi:MAG: N-acetylmuramic acid 6-phosphate etherase [Patescibacteria group bacterium]|jgi:N-acetylmuramic acid 6-phosphate etherase|nr:N-acetylmuramic acid 6-phosphate etherase [Patescibacteria group bacterium]